MSSLVVMEFSSWFTLLMDCARPIYLGHIGELHYVSTLPALSETSVMQTVHEQESDCFRTQFFLFIRQIYRLFYLLSKFDTPSLLIKQERHYFLLINKKRRLFSLIKHVTFAYQTKLHAFFAY